MTQASMSPPGKGPWKLMHFSGHSFSRRKGVASSLTPPPWAVTVMRKRPSACFSRPLHMFPEITGSDSACISPYSHLLPRKNLALVFLLAAAGRQQYFSWVLLSLPPKLSAAWGQVPGKEESPSWLGVGPCLQGQEGRWQPGRRGVGRGHCPRATRLSRDP